MLKDKIMLGAIIGILADSVKLIANYIMYSLDWTTMVFWQIVAARFLGEGDLSKPLALVIGGAADVVVSAALGVSFVLFIFFFGRKFLVIKSLGYGLLIWAILFGAFLSQTLDNEIHTTPLGIIVTLIAHSVFGLALGLFTMLLDKNETLSEVSTNEGRIFRIKSAFLPEPAYKLRSFKIKDKNKSSKPRKIKPKKLFEDN